LNHHDIDLCDGPSGRLAAYGGRETIVSDCDYCRWKLTSVVRFPLNVWLPITLWLFFAHLEILNEKSGWFIPVWTDYLSGQNSYTRYNLH
jgi:hypothetical protein